MIPESFFILETVYQISFYINSGAAKEAKECFGDDVAPRIQQQHYSDMTSKNLNISIDKRGLPSNAETEQPLSSHYSTVTNIFTPYDTPSPTAHQVSIFVFLPFFITSLLINNEKY